MRIKFNLNAQSIKDAQKRVKKYQKGVEQAVSYFIKNVCLWIMERSDYYLDKHDIGSLVKEDIKSGWKIVPTATGVKLINDASKSHFVEFGVGIVGEQQPHPHSSEAGYEYNVETGSKSVDGAWTFFVDSERLDLPVNALLAHNWYRGKRGKNGEGGQRLLVMTKGTKGAMFAYNALVDLKSGNVLKSLWDDAKERFLE